MDKSNSRLKIHLENDKLVMYGTPSESSGCVLRGALTLNLRHPTYIKSLCLHFYGTMSVSWSQMLGNGYERKFKDQQTLINHTWTYLSQQKENHLLAAGQYSYEFELILPGSLPESTHVGRYYLVHYQLKAVAERRSGFLTPNYAVVKDIHLSRQKFSITSDYYLDSILVTNHWTDKLEYEISIPAKVFTFGDTIPITIQALPLAPHLHVRYLSCTFKEYMTCRAINGWFNGKNKAHTRVIQYLRKDQNTLLDRGTRVHAATTTASWTFEINIQVPESMTDVQCDANSESVKVRHKLKIIMSIENQDGHISELRAVLPVIVAVTNSIGGLPAYEETWRTLPYDPTLMMTLLRQSTDRIHCNTTLPTYSSLYP